ncbi:MAG TPA: hypothetical protein VK996_12385 [Ramlibacter sp.]|nr:hypothetical protein [Ramlibacter sp.]
MSQQINLFRPKPRKFGVPLVIGVVALVAVAIAAYVQSLSADNERLRNSLVATTKNVADLKSAVASVQKQKGMQGSASDQATEIAALKPRVEAAARLMGSLRDGTMGSPEGFARYLDVLGGASIDGVWITNIAVSRGGAAVSISGRALRNESVMQYVGRANQVFQPLGVRFNAIELTPDTPPGPGAAPATVGFRIS